MFGLLSLESRYRLNDIDGNSGGTYLTGSGSGNNPSFPVPSTSPSKFDFDISQINTAAGKGKGSASDIKSAYELFSTGQTKGRALGYAQDIQRRYSSGLIQTYGSDDIRTAAANYLDSVGLPRLAQVVSVTPTVPTQPTTPVTPTTPTTPDKSTPIELLIDAFARSFGNAIYNPPLQNQASGFTGVEQGVPLTEGGSGSGIGTFIIIGVIGVVAYFLYKRFAG